MTGPDPAADGHDPPPYVEILDSTGVQVGSGNVLNVHQHIHFASPVAEHPMGPGVRASGPQLRQIRDALLDAFNEPELREFLLELKRDYDRMTSRADDLDANALRVVEAAERQNWLIPLLEKACALRPESRLWHFHRQLTQGSRDHLLVFIAYVGRDGRELAERLRDHLSSLAQPPIQPSPHMHIAHSRESAHQNHSRETRYTASRTFSLSISIHRSRRPLP